MTQDERTITNKIGENENKNEISTEKEKKKNLYAWKVRGL